MISSQAVESDQAVAVFTQAEIEGAGLVEGAGVSKNVWPLMVTAPLDKVAVGVATLAVAADACWELPPPFRPPRLALRCAVRTSSKVLPAMPPPVWMQYAARWPSFLQLEQTRGGLSLRTAARAVGWLPDCSARARFMASSCWKRRRMVLMPKEGESMAVKIEDCRCSYLSPKALMRKIILS